MRKILYLLPFLFLCFTAQAQQSALADFNLQQESTMRVGMLVLGGWAVVNILVASFKLTRSTRARRHFYIMNLYWNIVTMLIAGTALHLIASDDAITRALEESVRLHSSYKKLLYLSTGLALGCLILGGYLKERSRAAMQNERLLGWGQAVVLQGFFVFLLSLALVVLLEYNADTLFQLIPDVPEPDK